MVNGPDVVATSTEGVVDHHWNTLLVCQLCDLLEIRYIVTRVADALEVNRLCVVVDSSDELLGLVTINKLAVDAKPGEHDLELVVGSSVKIRSGDDVVAGLCKGSNGHELSSLARRGGHCSNTALEGSHALFEHIDSGLVVSQLPIAWVFFRTLSLTFIIRL